MEQDELSRLREELELVAVSGLPVKGGLKNLSSSELIAWKDGVDSTSAAAAEIAKRTLVAFDTLRAEVAVLREALGPLARQAALCGNASPEMIIGLIGGVENALRRKDADRAARVLSSTSPSPILAEIARLREALSEAAKYLVNANGDDLAPPRVMNQITDALASTSSTTLDRKDGE